MLKSVPADHADENRICSGLQTITSQPSTAAGLCRDADVFWLGEEAERFFTALAAEAACFHAAERDAQDAYEPAIHPDRAGVNLFRNAMRAIQVLRPNARGQAVLRVIGVADHF